jgi:hypothetical protein
MIFPAALTSLEYSTGIGRTMMKMPGSGGASVPIRGVAGRASSAKDLPMRTPIPRNLPSLVLLGVLLGCAGGATQTRSATAPGADVAGYTTFGWQPASDPEQGALSILDANLQEAIRARLIEKGYREVESNPELRISFERTTVVVEKASKPSPVRIGVGVGSWGGPVGVGAGTSVPVGGSGGAVTEQETTLTIRAVDPRTNREVWNGSSTGEIVEDLEKGAIEKIVAGTMAEFPNKRK